MQTPASVANDRGPAEDQILQDLGWFIRLRWIAAAGVLLFGIVTTFLLRVNTVFVPFVIVAVAIVACNLLYIGVYRRLGAGRLRSVSPHAFANIQIAFDWLLLTALVHFTGGIRSPALLYYLFHVIIAAILLTRAACYVQAGFAFLLVLVVVVLDRTGVLVALPLVAQQPFGAALPWQDVLLRLAFFGSTLGVAAFLATRLSQRLKRRTRELLDVEKELGVAITELKVADRELVDYTVKVTHELRAPLTAVKSLLNAITRGYAGELSPKINEAMQRAENRAETLLRLVSDLLNLASRTRAVATKPPTGVDIASVLHGQFGLYQEEARRKNLDYRLSLPDGRLVCRGHEEDFQMLFSNLIENAIKYTLPGGEVSVAIHKEGSLAELVVRDTGIGIPEKSIMRIFDKFHRAGNARRIAPIGTGLGLPLVKQIVETYDGHVIFSSREGKGTTFTVQLPLRGQGAPPDRLE